MIITPYRSQYAGINHKWFISYSTQMLDYTPAVLVNDRTKSRAAMATTTRMQKPTQTGE